MRRAAAVLLALMMIPLAVGETVDEELISDDEGDVLVATADGGASQPDGGQFQDVDLTSVGILEETEEDLTFYIEVKKLDTSSQNPLPFSDPDYRVYFQYGEQGYRLRLDTALKNVFNDAFDRSGTAFGALEVQVGESSFRNLASAEVELDYSDDRIIATIPRAPIVDDNQAPLSAGRTITNIYATSQSMGQFAFPVGQTGQGGDPLLYAGPPKAYDQAPDELAGQLPSYTLVTGELRQKGELVSGTHDPVRWTNGEASTLAFEVRVHNTGDQDLPVDVTVDKADPTWTLAYSDAITVPRNDAVNVTFLVTIPFSHQHGALHTFDATFETMDGSSFSTTMLGVYWPEVPQPAGHHDMLWFHSYVEEDSNNFFGDVFGAGTHAWFSALEDEDLDEGADIPAQFTIPPNTFTNGQGLAYWRIPLEPSLRMGLDFRTEDLGTLELGINFPSTVVDPELEVYLQHAEVSQSRGRNDDGIDNEQVLASGSAPAIAGPVSGDQLYTLELGVTDEADDIPYQQDVNLFMVVVLRATWLAGLGQLDTVEIAPQITPGNSWMQLPLNEYEVPLDLQFETDGSIELALTEDGQQKSVNPGETVVYAFNMAYHGTNTSDFVVTVSGTNVEWASVVGDLEFAMDAHGERLVGVAITAPRDAVDGERADVTLTVRDRSNAAVQAGVNTRTIVDSVADLDDESERAEGLGKELTSDKDTPGFPLLMLLAALAIALRRR